jgi:hypothetical protein
MLGCATDPSTEVTCINACTNNSPAGISAYNDLQACLSTLCPSPVCPTLPSTSATDF